MVLIPSWRDRTTGSTSTNPCTKASISDLLIRHIARIFPPTGPYPSLRLWIGYGNYYAPYKNQPYSQDRPIGISQVSKYLNLSRPSMQKKKRKKKAANSRHWLQQPLLGSTFLKNIYFKTIRRCSTFTHIGRNSLHWVDYCTLRISIFKCDNMLQNLVLDLYPAYSLLHFYARYCIRLWSRLGYRNRRALLEHKLSSAPYKANSLFTAYDTPSPPPPKAFLPAFKSGITIADLFL